MFGGLEPPVALQYRGFLHECAAIRKFQVIQHRKNKAIHFLQLLGNPRSDKGKGHLFNKVPGDQGKTQGLLSR